MRVEVVCNIIYLGVYGNPAITVIAMLLQIMETEGLGLIRRHDSFQIEDYRYLYGTKKMDINSLHLELQNFRGQDGKATRKRKRRKRCQHFPQKKIEQLTPPKKTQHPGKRYRFRDDDVGKAALAACTVPLSQKTPSVAYETAEHL